MPSFKIIGLLVLEKKILKGFYHIWAWRPSWLCDLDHLYKLSFPFPRRLHMNSGIDINLVELESPMLHAKVQDHRTTGSGEEDF